MKCRYIRYHPLLTIAPIKEEQISDNPAIWLFHDVITDNQIETMKNLALPKLNRAAVRNQTDGRHMFADYRISKSAWLKNNEHPHLSYLTSLVSAITNLTMETAEDWQVSSWEISIHSNDF